MLNFAEKVTEFIWRNWFKYIISTLIFTALVLVISFAIPFKTDQFLYALYITLIPHHMALFFLSRKLKEQGGVQKMSWGNAIMFGVTFYLFMFIVPIYILISMITNEIYI